MPVQSSSKLQRPVAPGSPALVPLGDHAGKPAIPLDRDITTIGSRHDARLHLLSRTVSKAHALIVISGASGQAYIRDLASRGHVYVNGKAVREVLLQDGDLIKIGTFTFRFSAGGRAARSGAAASAPAAHLEVDGADLPVPIADKVVLIGRRPTCDIALVEASVSTAHAAIVEINGKRFLRDLGSRTGSFVNGKRVRQLELSFGDQIRVGETEMRYTPVDLALDELSAGGIEEISPVLGEADFPPAGEIETDQGAENAVAAPETDAPSASAEIADESQQLLVDANLRQEKLSSSATHTDLQAEADKAIESATRVDEPDIADLLAVDERLKGTASPDVDEQPPAGQDELEPRRGWRSKRPAAVESDEPVETTAAPREQEADVEPPPAPPESDVQPGVVAEAAEDEVFRIPNEDDLNESGGGTAVLDEPPADEAVFEAERDSTLEQDLGLSPRLAEMAAAAPTDEDVASPPEVSELEAIGFEGLKFDEVESAPSATDEPEQRDIGAAPDKPLIELSPPVAEPIKPQEPPAAEVIPRPLIARDAIAPATPVESPAVEEPEVSSPLPPPATKRRAPRRKRKVDSTVIASSAPPAVEPTAPAVEPSEAVVEPSAPAIAPEPIEPTVEAAAIAFETAPELSPPAEVLETTEPTPESALDLRGAEIEAELEAQTLSTPGQNDLTDTTFSRAVEDFTGESTGPLVEESPEPPLDWRTEAEETAATALPEVAPSADVPAMESAIEEPISFETPAPAPMVEEPEPLPIEQITQAPEAEPPAQEELPPAIGPMPVPSFGADQAGFLGGSPLKLGNLVPPPRPRRGAPFGKKPLVAVDESDELPSAAFARGPFDVSPEDVPANARRQDEIPPYTGADPTAGQVTTGFDGLAMPPVREADVFSQMFPSAGASVDVTGQAPLDLVVPESNVRIPGRKSPASALDAPAEEFWGDQEQQADTPAQPQPVEAGATDEPSARPARASRAHRPAGRNIPPAPFAPPAETPAAPRKKKRWWTIRTLLVLMLLSMIAAAAGIYLLVPVQTVIVGTLKFSNFDQLTEFDRQAVVRQQSTLLEDPELRTLAQNLFKKNHPQTDAGFLADPVRFDTTMGSAKFVDDGDALTLVYKGRDPNAESDVRRVSAVMSALYNRNSALIDVRDRVQAQVQDLQRAIAATQTEVSRLESERDRLKPLFENRPSAARLAELQVQMEQREQQWNAAVTTVTHLRLEVEAMQQAAGIVPTTQPATPSTMPLVVATPGADPQIAELQKGLDEAAVRLAEQKQVDAERALSARKDLDAALEQFQQQIAAAQGTLQNNPELQAYLDEAQSLQQAMRKLTVELIDRQQEQHIRLTELKQRLDEKMQERRSDAWQNDPQLREFGERLAMTRRAQNAALASGLEEEAADLQAKVKLLEEMVRSRQELVGQDTLMTDTIKQLEELIASTEKQLADDRKSSEEMMARLQKSFAQNQAGKLPAEQQALAADLEKRIAEMNAARAQYASALVESTGGGVDAKQLETVVADLQSKIEIRKAELERQNQPSATSDNASSPRMEQLKTRQGELAAAQEVEAKAQASYFKVHNEYQELTASAAQARAAGDKLDETIRELDVKKGQLMQQQDQLEAKNRELARAAAPLPVTDDSVKVGPVQDQRSMIILASWGGIALLFVIMISIVSASSSGEVPIAAVAPPASDTGEPDIDNAASNGHANGDQAEHDAPAEVARL